MCVKYDFVKGESWAPVTVRDVRILRGWKWEYLSMPTRVLPIILVWFGIFHSKLVISHNLHKAGLSWYCNALGEMDLEGL